MMSTAPPLQLTHDQASRLQTYLQTYRRYAFAFLAPGADRNNTLRILQTIQGKLIDVMDQRTALLVLALTGEEMATLKTSIAELYALYAKKTASAERNTTLIDLASLKGNLERYH
jgi:hypothetical protein